MLQPRLRLPRPAYWACSRMEQRQQKTTSLRILRIEPGRLCAWHTPFTVPLYHHSSGVQISTLRQFPPAEHQELGARPRTRRSKSAMPTRYVLWVSMHAPTGRPARWSWGIDDADGRLLNDRHAAVLLDPQHPAVREAEKDRPVGDQDHGGGVSGCHARDRGARAGWCRLGRRSRPNGRGLDTGRLADQWLGSLEGLGGAARGLPGLATLACGGGAPVGRGQDDQCWAGAAGPTSSRGARCRRELPAPYGRLPADPATCASSGKTCGIQNGIQT
jgi:hypothetical protein